jgi:DNA-binding transcriptional LysR family regulator
MDVHVRDLRYFLAVADELNFTRAAERLFVSQPALSKQIRALEQQLRTPLFERDRRSTRLTEAGNALLPHARELVARWDEAQRAVSDVAAREAAVLTLGFSTSIGRGLLPQVRALFAERQPEWTLTLKQVPWSDPSAGLADGSSDVALVWLPVPELDEAYSCQVLATEPRHVALPLGHRLAALDVVPFADLLDEPFLALPETAGPLRGYWLGEAERGGRPPVVAAVVTTADETFEAVANGVGVVLLSAGNAALYARADVITRPVSGLGASELAVVWRDDDHRTVIRDFVLACTSAADSVHTAT